MTGAREPEDRQLRLWMITDLIRSKNAGPFLLTIDLMFREERHYSWARRGRLSEPSFYAELYGVDPADVSVFPQDVARALKISMPRPVPSGSTADRDVYGGQFHSPLVMLEVDIA
ncbi:MAG TPA: DUF4387 domain-containing protein [Mycobacteriales bacterium]|nr:DUF4387 domain-containing protein [Mycobacteriales bacterium]